MISALDAKTSTIDVETSAFGAATSAIARRSSDATISAFDAETSAIARSYKDIGAEFPAISAIAELVYLRRCVTELLIMEI